MRYGLGYLVGVALGALDAGRCRVLRHMGSAFGMPRAHALLPRYYEHIGLLVVEYALMCDSRRSGSADPIAPDGIERVRDILARGRGAVLVTGHVGNWEMAGLCLASNGVPLHALYRPLENPHLDGQLRGLRERSGMRVYEHRASARSMMRALRDGEAVGLLMDQDGSGWGVFVPFLGRLGSTLPTAARIARRTGAAILPVTCYRTPDRVHHRLRVGPEVEQADTGDEERDVLVTTRNCNRALEEAVLEHPAQWLWRHRRWRTRPSADDVRAWEEASDHGAAPGGRRQPVK